MAKDVPGADGLPAAGDSLAPPDGGPRADDVSAATPAVVRPGDPGHASDVEEKVRRQYRAMLLGDVAAAVETTAADWVNDEARGEPPACATPGPGGLLATGAWLRFAFSDLEIDEKASLADEDHVISYVTMSGRHTGPMVVFDEGRPVQVLPPTGKTFSVRQVHIHRLRGSDIVGHSAVRDDLGLITQLGGLPPTPKGLARLALWRVSGRAAGAGREAARLATRATQAASRHSASSG